MAKPPTLGSRFSNNIKAIEQTNLGKERDHQHHVSPDRIIPSVFQPRRYFDADSLLELQTSIQQLGILEPLVVRTVAERPDCYELIAGERRWRCARELQLKTVPIVILDLTDEEAYLAALHDNSHREDLNPIDETEYILRLLGYWLKLDVEGVKSLLYRLRNQKASGNISTEGVTDDERSLEIVSKTIGQVKKGLTPISFVETRLPLLKLPEEVLAALRAGKIEYTKAKSIARIEAEDERKDLLKMAIEQDLSLNDIKKQVKNTRKDIAHNPAESTEEQSMRVRYKQISSRLQKSAVWDNPSKKKSLERLLAQIETLIGE